MVKITLTSAMSLIIKANKKENNASLQVVVSYALAFGYCSPVNVTQEYKNRYKENNQMYLDFISTFGESTTFEEALSVCMPIVVKILC